MTKQERLENIFNNLIDEFDLDHGNAGFDDLDEEGRFIGYIEAPNNTTLTVDVNFDLDEELTDEKIKEKFIEGVKDAIYYFDPEETFEELWHPDFAFGAFQFVEMLKEDEKYFQDVKDEL